VKNPLETLECPLPLVEFEEYPELEDPELEDPEPEDPELEDPVDEDEEEDEVDEEVTLEQERSKRGVVLMLAPTVPKLGEDPASSRVYQKMLTFPNRGHPTSSQYFFALASDGTPKFWLEPLTGHPVSVIQTSFPPTAACV